MQNQTPIGKKVMRNLQKQETKTEGTRERQWHYIVPWECFLDSEWTQKLESFSAH